MKKPSLKLDSINSDIPDETYSSSKNFPKVTSTKNSLVGLKNGFRENSCYINVCIQTIYNLKFLRYNLLNENFQIYKETPEIIKELLLLLSAYQNNEEENILNTNDFRSSLAEYFKNKNEFQINEKGDPIELLNILLIFIHTYITSDFHYIGYNDENCHLKCFIHNLFYINIKEEIKCNKCNLNQKMNYDNNNFMYLIFLNEIIEKENIYLKDFNSFKENLIKYSNLEKKICPKCNNSNVYFNQNCLYSGYYFIFQISYNNNKIIDFSTLFKILCMINCSFQANELFTTVKNNKNYKFRGLMLLSSNHYVSLFYNVKEKMFYLYNDTKIIVFSLWEKVIEFIVENRYLPIAIFYEDNAKNQNECEFNISFEIYEQLYNKYKERDEINDRENNNDYYQNLNDGEWICSQCNQINSPNNSICIKCNFKNEIIEKLINQNYRNYLNNNSNEERVINPFNSGNNSNFQNNTNNENSNENPFDRNSNCYENNNEEVYNNNKNLFFDSDDIKKLEENHCRFDEENKLDDEWICEFCKTKNEMIKEKCKNCGRRRGGIQKKNNKVWSCMKCGKENIPIENEKCECGYVNTIISITRNILKKSFI